MSPTDADSPSPVGDRPRFDLPRTRRLRSDRDFRIVYRHGTRVRGRAITIVANPRRGPFSTGEHRVGLSVSKEHGNAVRRNKIKRLLREAFRLERPNLPGVFDFVLIPNKRDGRYELDELREELVVASARLARDSVGSDSKRRNGGRRPPRRRRGANNPKPR